jgi:DNA mismatch repair protein MutS2
MLFDSASQTDLQWDEITQMLQLLSYQPTAQQRCAQLMPMDHGGQLKVALGEMQEFYALFNSGGSLPSGEFNEIHRVLKMLSVRDAVLVEKDFQDIVQNTEIVHDWIKLYNLMGKNWIHLGAHFTGLTVQSDLIPTIQRIFNPQWQVRDDASPILKTIRESMVTVRRQITKNFQKVLRDMQSKGYIAATEEGYQNERKVLAVVSSYKKNVSGIITGSSKTGSITFIEPSINIPLNNEMEILKEEERREIRKILFQLTQAIRGYHPFLNQSLKTLIHFDFLRAKARLGLKFQGIIPQVLDHPGMLIKQGVHPLLYMQHLELKKPTFGQDVNLNQDQRILVISGPNAGGKSVTMKMIGLIQVLFQCAIPVPAKQGTALGVFHSFLTDIGDHQSIENQLSTYSYRLKRMRYFLEVSNRRSLVLLDEFGTGSDPDLGGALAEVFFEELYHKKTIGVITTHYSNIKLRAESLPQAINGHMQFDAEALLPKYHLISGKAGSSFTFEVAQANGINEELLTRAKKKINQQKLKWDQLLLDLEKEKQQWTKQREEADKLNSQAQNKIEQFTKKNEQLSKLTEKKNAQWEKEQVDLNMAKKMKQFIQSVKARGKNTELWDEVKKYVLMEHSKIEQAKRKDKIKKQKQAIQEEQKEDFAPLNLTDLVRIKQTKQVGIVTKIEDKGITVVIGNFKTLISRDKIIKI